MVTMEEDVEDVDDGLVEPELQIHLSNIIIYTFSIDPSSYDAE